MADGLRLYSGAFNHKDFISVEVKVDVGLALSDPEQEPFFLAPDCSDADLGDALQKAFAGFRVIAPELEEARTIYKRVFEYGESGKWATDLMARFGYKRKGQLYKRLHYCFIDSFEGIITISPTNHDQPDGWSGLGESEKVRIPDTSTPEEIGAALRLGFSRCWGKY